MLAFRGAVNHWRDVPPTTVLEIASTYPFDESCPKSGCPIVTLIPYDIVERIKELREGSAKKRVRRPPFMLFGSEKNLSKKLKRIEKKSRPKFSERGNFSPKGIEPEFTPN